MGFLVCRGGDEAGGRGEDGGVDFGTSSENNAGGGDSARCGVEDASRVEEDNGAEEALS